MGRKQLQYIKWASRRNVYLEFWLASTIGPARRALSEACPRSAGIVKSMQQARVVGKYAREGSECGEGMGVGFWVEKGCMRGEVEGRNVYLEFWSASIIGPQDVRCRKFAPRVLFQPCKKPALSAGTQEKDKRVWRACACGGFG